MTDINEFPAASTPESGAEQPAIAIAALYVAAAQLATEAESDGHYYYYTGARDAFETVFAAAKGLPDTADRLFEADIDLAGLPELERDALLFNCRSMMMADD